MAQIVRDSRNIESFYQTEKLVGRMKIYRGGLNVYSSRASAQDKMSFYGAIQQDVSIMVMCGNFNSYFILNDKMSS